MQNFNTFMTVSGYDALSIEKYLFFYNSSVKPLFKIFNSFNEDIRIVELEKNYFIIFRIFCSSQKCHDGMSQIFYSFTVSR